jgi:hypothetical protein
MARPRLRWCGAAGRATPSSSHPPRGPAPGWPPLDAGVRAAVQPGVRGRGRVSTPEAQGSGVVSAAWTPPDGRCPHGPHGCPHGRATRGPAIRIRPGCSPCGAAACCLSALLHRTVRPVSRLGRGVHRTPDGCPVVSALSASRPHTATMPPRPGRPGVRAVDPPRFTSQSTVCRAGTGDGRQSAATAGAGAPGRADGRPVDGLQPVSQSRLVYRWGCAVSAGNRRVNGNRDRCAPSASSCPSPRRRTRRASAPDCPDPGSAGARAGRRRRGCAPFRSASRCAIRCAP